MWLVYVTLSLFTSVGYLMYLMSLIMSHISVVVPQRTWSPTRPPWRSATLKWDAISQSLPTPTILPTKNYRHDTQRTWMKLWAACRSFTTDWRLALKTRTRLLPLTETTTKPCPYSKVAVSNNLPPLPNQFLVTHSQFKIHLAAALLHILKIGTCVRERLCINLP